MCVRMKYDSYLISIDALSRSPSVYGANQSIQQVQLEKTDRPR